MVMMLLVRGLWMMWIRMLTETTMYRVLVVMLLATLAVLPYGDVDADGYAGTATRDAGRAEYGCAGVMMWSWVWAMVTLPRKSAAESATQVPTKRAKPGKRLTTSTGHHHARSRENAAHMFRYQVRARSARNGPQHLPARVARGAREMLFHM